MTNIPEKIYLQIDKSVKELSGSWFEKNADTAIEYIRADKYQALEDDIQLLQQNYELKNQINKSNSFIDKLSDENFKKDKANETLKEEIKTMWSDEDVVEFINICFIHEFNEPKKESMKLAFKTFKELKK